MGGLMAVRFTPGPWIQSRHDTNSGRVITLTAHAERPYGVAADSERCRDTYQFAIAYVGKHKCHFSADESAANAHLIAAAPEMYAALDAFLDNFNAELDDDQCEVYDQAMKALAKARGESA